MPRQISVRLKLTKCMTNHQKWACTAEMFPAGAAPLWLATFSEPLVKIRCYSPLGKLQLCVESWKKKTNLSHSHWQIIPAALLSTHLHPPRGLHDNFGCSKTDENLQPLREPSDSSFSENITSCKQRRATGLAIQQNSLLASFEHDETHEIT